MADSPIGKARLLNLYHRKSALSSLPNGYAPYFQLGNVQWGYGLIDSSGTQDVLLNIPGDLPALEEVFAEGTANYTYINGKIIIVATLPREKIPDAETRRFSMLSIMDNDRELVGAVVVPPQNVSNKMDVSITLEIDTTKSTSELKLVE